MKTKLEIGNLFWGAVLILAAVFVILGQYGVFGDVSIITIFFGVGLGIWFVSSILKLSWGGMLFSLAFEILLFDETLGLEELTPWPVLLAAFLATMGLNILIKKDVKVDTEKEKLN